MMSSAAFEDEFPGLPETEGELAADPEGPEDPAEARRAARWRTLPPRIPPDQLVVEIPTTPPADPDAGRDPDHDWMLRYAGS